MNNTVLYKGSYITYTVPDGMLKVTTCSLRHRRLADRVISRCYGRRSFQRPLQGNVSSSGITCLAECQVRVSLLIETC